VPTPDRSSDLSCRVCRDIDRKEAPAVSVHRLGHTSVSANLANVQTLGLVYGRVL
jgi:hypothetical protein